MSKRTTLFEISAIFINISIYSFLKNFGSVISFLKLLYIMDIVFILFVGFVKSLFLDCLRCNEIYFYVIISLNFLHDSYEDDFSLKTFIF